MNITAYTEGILLSLRKLYFDNVWKRTKILDSLDQNDVNKLGVNTTLLFMPLQHIKNKTFCDGVVIHISPISLKINSRSFNLSSKTYK